MAAVQFGTAAATPMIAATELATLLFPLSESTTSSP